MNSCVLTFKIDGIVMEIFRSKIFLAAVVLAILLWAGSAASEQKVPEEQPGATAAENSSLSENTPTFKVPDAQDEFDPGKEFGKMMLTVLLVIVLGIGVLYLSKKVLPKISNSPARSIHVIETVHLGPRRCVHLLEVGDRRLLIGSTNENITKLAEICLSGSDEGQEVR